MANKNFKRAPKDFLSQAANFKEIVDLGRIDYLDLSNSSHFVLSLRNLKMDGWKFSDSFFSAVKFVDCDLRGCDFSGASFMDVLFLRCDLRESSFEAAYLRRVTFEMCTRWDLHSTNLEGAVLTGVTLDPSWRAGVLGTFIEV